MKPLQRPDRPDFDRFLRVIRREGGRDYVPFFELIFDMKHVPAVTGIPTPPNLNFYPNSPTFEESFGYYFRCMEKLGFDHGTINICGFGGYPIKRHGVDGTQRSFVTEEQSSIANWEDFEKYPWPSVATVNVDAMERTARLAPEGLGVMTGAEGLFQPMTMILGVTNMSMMLYDDIELFQAVADRIGSTQEKVFDLVASLPYVRGVQVSGDMGHKTGPLVSPEILRKYILPWHKKFVDAIHRHGKFAILHSCGNLAGIMEDLIACGYDAKHSFEDAIHPGLVELHAQYGRRICLLGGVDVDFLCRSDEDAIRARVREYIDTLAPNGGWALGSGNSIPDYVPTEHWWAMLDEGLKYGR